MSTQAMVALSVTGSSSPPTVAEIAYDHGNDWERDFVWKTRYEEDYTKKTGLQAPDIPVQDWRDLGFRQVHNDNKNRLGIN